MKFFSYFAVIIMTLVLCTSCDKNEGMSKELAQKFVTAYNEGDKAGVYDLFPAIKEFSNLQISGKLNEEDLSVEKYDSTNQYVVTIDEQRNQKLVYEADSTDNLRLVDSYGVFHLDSLSNEIALKTGVPLKKISDIEQAKILDPEGYFMKFLAAHYCTSKDALWTEDEHYLYGRNSIKYYCTLIFNVHNLSKVAISGKDYYVEITTSQVSTAYEGSTRTLDGVDIAPGEKREFKVDADECCRWAMESDLKYNATVKMRPQSVIDMLLNYGNFKGEEYDEFMKKPDQMLVEERGEQYMAKSAKKTVIYVYSKPDVNSTATDTLYHGKPVTIVKDFSLSKWVKAFEDYVFIGYIQESDITPYDAATAIEVYECKVEDKSGIVNVYKDKGLSGEPVKKLKSGTTIWTQSSEWENTQVYEKQPDGSLKLIGNIHTYNIADDYDN